MKEAGGGGQKCPRMAKEGLDEPMKRAKGWLGMAVAVGLAMGCSSAAWAHTEIVDGVTWSCLVVGKTATATEAAPERFSSRKGLRKGWG